MMKNLITTKPIRLLILLMCLAATIPQMSADVIVAGNSTALFGGSWSTSTNSSNKMTQYNSTNYYYLTKSNVSLPGNLEFKVVDNGNWYGSGNNGSGGNVTCNASGTHTITFLYNSNSHEVDRIGTFSTDVIVAGSDTQTLGGSWANSNLSNAMTTSDGLTFTLTRTAQYTSGGDKQFKVHSVTTDRWYGTSSGGNVYYNIPAAGEYEVTYTFNVITREVSASVTAVSSGPTTPTYYITGDNGLGLGGFKYDPTTTLTDEGNGIYTYSYNVTTAGNYYFAFGDGQGSDWNDFNGNHRIGPSSGNVEVSLDGTWVNTQKGGGSYFVNVDVGPVTITLDASSSQMRFKVEGTAPTATVDYYVVGTDTGIFPNGWNTGSENLMTDNGNGTYTWNVSNVHLLAGTSYEYKVLGSDNSWHPSGVDNATFTVNANGTYNVVFTFDGTNVNAVPTLMQEDPTYNYTFYVLPSDDTTAPHLYLWAASNNNYHPNGDWSGDMLNTTEQLADGNNWYKYSEALYYNNMNAIVNNGNGGQTADITDLAPGTYYIRWNVNDNTYTLDTNPPTPTYYYVVGEDNTIFPNQWNTGAETLMTENNGTYTWTASNVHLEMGEDYEYKVLGSDGNWYPASGTPNASFNVTANGNYNVVFTFDGTNVTAVPSLVLEDQTYTYDIYVRYEGNEALSNVYVFSWDDFTTLSDSWDGNVGGTPLSSLSSQVINGFTYYHVTYTSYASTNIGVIFNENGSSSTQTSNLTANQGNNYYTYGGGSDVTGPSSQPDVPDYYVVGEDTNLFPNQWNIGAETLMTENNGTYTWTLNNIQLDADVNYEYKVRGTDGSWHPDGADNASFSVDARGTYNVVFTFDGTNVNAVATLVQADPIYTYDIYVRYTGNEDVSNVYLYAWDNEGELSAGWSGTALSLLTPPQVINGYTYYHVTYTSYDSSIGIIFNENGTSQTANLTAEPGDNYFTYGGGNIVDGPNDEADAPPTTMYLIGNAGSQQWAANAGIAMVYDDATGYFKLENIVLTANSHFAFASALGSNSEDWETLNSHRLSSTGNGNWLITQSMFDTWLDYVNYSSEDHNWYVEQAGAYDIYVDPINFKVMVSAPHQNMYISYGVNWSYENNSVQMTTVDGNIYQATITFTQGDFFLFSTALSDETAWGATDQGYEITNLMIGFAQKLNQGSTNNYYFNGTSGKYIVVVNLEKGTVTLRKTADVTVTKVFLQKTPNVTLDPAGGTYNGQTLEGKRGGIYAWNKLNLEEAGGTYRQTPDHGPTNYTYENEVFIDGQPYGGNNKLKDLPDTTTVDGKQWYAWSIGNSICEFYFIRNNKTDYKSQNIIRRAGEVWLIWLDEDATEDRQDDAQHLDKLQDVTSLYYDVTASGVSDCSTMLEDHYYVYYTNTTAWDSVYCYAWNSNHDLIEFTDAYPGNKCTFVGYDEDGYEVWCYDFGLMEDFHSKYGEDENGEYIIPTGIIFNNGMNEDTNREQTGDLLFDNGACYDYLGMVYLGNSLNGIINSGIVNGPKYTVEDDLVGVYYDENAVTKIMETDISGNPILDQQGQPRFIDVKGALYAKDMENYSAKSIQPDGTTDYVYNICAHPANSTYPGGSQIQIMRDHYDQSNWVKVVLSPNFDNTHLQNTDVTYDKDQFDHEDFETATADGRNYLEQYVGKVIPGGSMSGNLVSNINPQMHITNIAKPVEMSSEYEKNVYVTAHFNDSVVFSYVHQDWSPGIYNGVYRTVPHLAVNEDNQTFVDYVEVDKSVLYKMFYVAPKPQEVAFITWAVFQHDDPTVGTNECTTEPDDPGAFYSPMNWDRTGMLWDGTNPTDPNAPWGTTYGPYSNGFMQYGAFQVNWSLYGDDNHYNESGEPWYKTFKPGQAYKILAIIRYTHGANATDVEYTAGVIGSGDYNEGPGNHVSNAPRREGDVPPTYPNMSTVPYDDLDQSKFVVFPLMGSNNDSNGDDIGNVTAVKEVVNARTVVAVRYYNLMGMESDKPFSGINIVVTTYSDGSRSSRKILR